MAGVSPELPQMAASSNPARRAGFFFGVPSMLDSLEAGKFFNRPNGGEGLPRRPVPECQESQNSPKSPAAVAKILVSWSFLARDKLRYRRAAGAVAELGCSPIRKQGFKNSGLRDVADSRYHRPRIPRSSNVPLRISCRTAAQNYGPGFSHQSRMRSCSRSRPWRRCRHWRRNQDRLQRNPW